MANRLREIEQNVVYFRVRFGKNKYITMELPLENATGEIDLNNADCILYLVLSFVDCILCTRKELRCMWNGLVRPLWSSCLLSFLTLRIECVLCQVDTHSEIFDTSDVLFPGGVNSPTITNKKKELNRTGSETEVEAKASANRGTCDGMCPTAQCDGLAIY